MENKEERKYKEEKTSELLDFIGKEFDYTKDKELDKQTDMLNELGSRKPFTHIKNKIDRMEREIKELQTQVKFLLKHKHSDGQIVAPLER